MALRLIGIITIGVIVLSASAYLLLDRLGDGMCGSTLVSTVESPDARRVAVLYEFNCGATTDFGTHISILATGRPLPDTPGNAFVADTDHGRAPIGAGNIIAVTLRWIGSDSLIVEYDARARVFKHLSRVGNVMISYVPLASGA